MSKDKDAAEIIDGKDLDEIVAGSGTCSVTIVGVAEDAVTRMETGDPDFQDGKVQVSKRPSLTKTRS